MIGDLAPLVENPTWILRLASSKLANLIGGCKIKCSKFYHSSVNKYELNFPQVWDRDEPGWLLVGLTVKLLPLVICVKSLDCR